MSPLVPGVPTSSRLVDGDFQYDTGTITIPDGVLGFSISVLAGGSDADDTSDWVTLDGPDFVAPIPLIVGQSISHTAGDGDDSDTPSTLSGPFVVTVPAAGAANATWVLP